MAKRFTGVDGRVALLNALRAQFLVDGNADIADKIAGTAQVKEFAPGSPLFTQGERTSELCFILVGQVSVRMAGREIATCGAGLHVGEVGLLEPFKGRSATVVATEKVVAAEITEKNFTEIANYHPELWRRMAVELARRLVKSQSGG